MSKDNFSKGDVPLGFGMALAQSAGALKYFSSLSPAEQDSVVARSRDMSSKEDMQRFIDGLSERHSI